MGASRGGKSGRRRAFRGPTAAAITINSNGPSSARRDDNSWLLFGGTRGGGAPEAQQKKYHPQSQQNQNLGENIFAIQPPIPHRCCFPDQREHPDLCIHSHY